MIRNSGVDFNSSEELKNSKSQPLEISKSKQFDQLCGKLLGDINNMRKSIQTDSSIKKEKLLISLKKRVRLKRKIQVLIV